MMIVFEIGDMTCGHCASTITKVVKQADPDAEVRVEVAQHRVEIVSRVSDVETLRAAIQGAGFTPVVV